MTQKKVKTSITFTAPKGLISRARLRARANNRTLNELFNDWLGSMVNSHSNGDIFDKLMDELSTVNSGGPYSREELNER